MAAYTFVRTLGLAASEFPRRERPLLFFFFASFVVTWVMTSRAPSYDGRTQPDHLFVSRL